MTEVKNNKDILLTHLVQDNLNNTGILSKTDDENKYNKFGCNPLFTILNKDFNKQLIRDYNRQRQIKKQIITLEYLQEIQPDIIKQYQKYYPDTYKDKLEECLITREDEPRLDFMHIGLDNITRSIPISLKDINTYKQRNGYCNYVFSNQARPEILVFDFDLVISNEDIKKIEKTFRDTLYLIEYKPSNGHVHLYINSTENETITYANNSKEVLFRKGDEKVSIDVFKGSNRVTACTTRNNEYEIIYDEKPVKSIKLRNAILMLAKTLNYTVNMKFLKELTSKEKKSISTIINKTDDNSTTNTLDIRQQVILNNAIAIFKAVEGRRVRETLYMSLTGALLRHGINNKQTLTIMKKIHDTTHDKDPRIPTVRKTIDKYQKGINIFGWNNFQEIVKTTTRDQQTLKHLEQLGHAIHTSYIQEVKINKLNLSNDEKENTTLLEDTNNHIYDYRETCDNENIHIIQDKYSDYKIIVDYENKTISKRAYKKQGRKEDKNIIVTDELIITAVPIDLTIYNDTICNTGTTYECTWQFQDGTSTEISGDIILHKKILDKKAGVWNRNLLQNTISTVFGDLTKTKAHNTIIKHAPNKRGFYYDKNHDKIIVVDHEIKRPTKKQLYEAIKLLDIYGCYFGYGYYSKKGYVVDEKTGNKKDTFTIDNTRLAVSIRWGLNAPFHYVRKQMGNTDEKYLLFDGESRVGKTTGYEYTIIYLMGIDDPKTYLASGGSNSKAQISKNLAKGTFPIFIDEGDGIFNKPNLTSMLKFSVQNLTSREVTDMDTNELAQSQAFANLCFTSNSSFIDTEKGGLTNRIIELKFYSRDIPTPEAKKRFQETFKTQYLPDDKRRILKYIGYEFQARILEDPEIYKHTNPDQVVKEFFTDICYETGYVTLLDWINKDIPQKTGEDNLKERHEDLKDLLKRILNNYMKHTIIKEREESYGQQTIQEAIGLDIKDKIIYLAESRRISWLNIINNHKQLLIGKGVLLDLKREDPTCNINNLEDFQDILISAKYNRYDIRKYTVTIADENGNSKKKQLYNNLKVDIDTIVGLYKNK